MRGVVLQHAPEDPPALLGAWLRERGIPFDTLEVWNDGLPGDPLEFSWIAALGAHDSATDEEPAWVLAEVDLLRRAVAADVPVLGICFGAQALAAALGAEISPVDPLTIGWLETRTLAPDIVPAGPWIHFNSERFSLPEGATLLARSPGGPAAFRLGPHLGVQFHPEATPGMVNDWAQYYSELLAEHGFSRERLREDGRIHGAAGAAAAFKLFDAWWATAGVAAASRGVSA
jgi:GMP synthase-like glutamine amidotransferase